MDLIVQFHHFLCPAPLNLETDFLSLLLNTLLKAGRLRDIDRIYKYIKQLIFFHLLKYNGFLCSAFNAPRHILSIEDIKMHLPLPPGTTMSL